MASLGLFGAAVLGAAAGHREAPMNLECHACGKRFRSMNAESVHRHNWPALCKRNKRFAAFIAETQEKRDGP
jgi:hypothetical protein